ncbi:bifunctional hydroxymethylpyrimidine kinase/phosphomethylpyrimidine kinase [Solicola sp. PLA-1-18]|uniref:bifunctional hydroxymethylpyrimidine kinase/phosphomethylpyrimidine kinase n=1 Tax=Solicola sp. PLA-1-18 TaxID=3380532 RepID=UPI003B8136BC
MSREPVVLAIAGSDPSGGAGIQADLKTVTELGVYGATVVTGLTVQDTTGVHDIHPVPPDFVVAQYEAVVADLDVRAVKIGMLGDAVLVRAVAGALRRHPVPAVVLDPVMVATSGDRLVPEDAVAAIRDELLPLATVVTPNLPEAEALVGGPVAGPDQMADAGRRLLGLGAAAALVKGGHAPGDRDLVDVLVDADGVLELPTARVRTPNTHGTGCTLSSAVAAGLAVGLPLGEAVLRAKAFLAEALEAGADLEIGRGHGPVDHLRGRRRPR